MIKLTNANPALGHVWVNPWRVTHLSIWHYKKGHDGESDPLDVTYVHFGGRFAEVSEPIDAVMLMVMEFLMMGRSTTAEEKAKLEKE